MRSDKTHFHIIITLLFLLAVGLPACKKFTRVDLPVNQISSAKVFATDADAVSAISGIYSKMISSNGFAGGGFQGIGVTAGLSADELVNYSTSADLAAFAGNALLPANTLVKTNLWQEAYQYIYDCNSVLQGLALSGTVSTATANQLKGEALFLRAFCNFYLVNLFGDIPLISSLDYQVNNQSARTAQADVYTSIINDLTTAQTFLPEAYASAGERVRPNRTTVTALLARVYLYQGQWANAETQASAVIGNNVYLLEPDLNNVFLKSSNEAIWQLKPVVPGVNTNDGALYILVAIPNVVALAPGLLNAFDSGDVRRIKWIGSFASGASTFYYPLKYKIKSSNTLSEYATVFRLAELYLLRAEARVQQANYAGALDDINKIRRRAGVKLLTITDKAALLLAIEHERQTELFTEWGHRWLDLKRTHRADSILQPLKGNSWQSTDIFYPIPQTEITNDPHLSQNPGY